MKRVFLDTNILLDYALGREYANDAMQLLQRGCNGEFQLAASYLTFANMAYVIGNKANLYAMFSDLCRYITILPMDESQFHAALGKKVKDFEDMLQYQCSKAAGCDVIITNNKKDFASFCDVPLLTAAEFLASMN